MCREFVEAAKQRCGHSCLRCTSAAVMLPPWTQEEESEHMGAGSESQPAGSPHLTAQICRFLMHKPLPKTVALRLSHYQINQKKSRMTSGDTVRPTGCQPGWMSNGWILVGNAVSLVSPHSSNAQCLRSKTPSKATNSPVTNYLGYNLERSHFWSQWFLYLAFNSSKQIVHDNLVLFL